MEKEIKKWLDIYTHEDRELCIASPCIPSHDIGYSSLIEMQNKEE